MLAIQLYSSISMGISRVPGRKGDEQARPLGILRPNPDRSGHVVASPSTHCTRPSEKMSTRALLSLVIALVAVGTLKISRWPQRL